MPRTFVLIATLALATASSVLAADGEVKRYVRYSLGDTIRYGIVDGEQVREIEGDLFGEWRLGKRVTPLSSVKLLAPVERPSQVIALAGSYKSHLGAGDFVTTVVTTTKVTTNPKTGQTTSDSKTTVDSEKPGEVPAKFQTPQVFFKTPACLIADGEPIVIPPGTNDVHYEAELVIVIGRKAQRVDEAGAEQCILGVACGNDVSARDWQKGDVQWWRAKGSDTFGPVGPVIASGLDYDNLLVTLRLNGEVKQQENTSQLIHSVPKLVSFISQYVTLQPGDLIFTGTSGRTSSIKPGDTVEVEIEGVGKLSNPVRSTAE